MNKWLKREVKEWYEVIYLMLVVILAIAICLTGIKEVKI